PRPLKHRACRIEVAGTSPAMTRGELARGSTRPGTAVVHISQTIEGLSRGLDATPAAPHSLSRQSAGRPLRYPALPSPTCGRPGRGTGEESPGSMDMRCRITSGGGDPRDSATESRPPRISSPPATGESKEGRRGKGEMVR